MPTTGPELGPGPRLSVHRRVRWSVRGDNDGCYALMAAVILLAPRVTTADEQASH